MAWIERKGVPDGSAVLTIRDGSAPARTLLLAEAFETAATFAAASH